MENPLRLAEMYGATAVSFPVLKYPDAVTDNIYRYLQQSIKL
jgi:hypothetical protein